MCAAEAPFGVAFVDFCRPGIPSGADNGEAG